MRGRFWFVLIFCLALLTPQASADTRLIVRSNGGVSVLRLACALLGCTVQYGLGDPQGQVFLVTAPDLVNPGNLIRSLRLTLGIASVELDIVGRVLQSASNGYIPNELFDATTVDYFGQTVRRGYVHQVPAQRVRLLEMQSRYGARGRGIVAVIDTGVDENHPLLMPVLVAGYDFTRNSEGGGESGDVQQSTAALVDGNGAAWVNQSTAALVDQSTAALVDDRSHAAFGHGTMVAGVIHLVAPNARIMSLKAFKADGSGYMSDILRAVYRGVQSGAKVLNMSFSCEHSEEMGRAIAYAKRRGVIAVASMGNDGMRVEKYPAAYEGVIAVAATNNADQRASFSNYGPTVWVAAPGDGVITLYPFGSYAAAWGTSFSVPFVSGAAALMLESRNANFSDVANAVAQARSISGEMGNGRLDLYRTVKWWDNDNN